MGLICGSGAVRWMYELRFGNVLGNWNENATVL